MKNQTLVTISAILVLFISACHEPQETTTSSISFAIEGYGRDTIHLYQVEPMGIARNGDFVFSFICNDGADLRNSLTISGQGLPCPERHY